MQLEETVEEEVKQAPEKISIVYYCRECQKVTTAKSMGRRKKYTFKCDDCGNICSYGTSRGVVNFFRIKEGGTDWNAIHQPSS